MLPPAALRFHNEMSAKTCPGTSQDKAEWIKAIAKAPGPDDSLAGSERGAFDDSATRVFAIGRSMLNSDPQPDDMSDAEYDPGAVTDSLSEPDDGGRGLFGGIDPGIPAELAEHVVNLSNGRFSRSGILSSAETDVDRIFEENLPAEIEAARAQGRPARLLLYAHGGLVN